MRKSAIRLTILSIILLVSISSVVLGTTNYTTSTPNVTGTSVKTNTTNVTGAPTVTNIANVTATETKVKTTTVPTPERVVVTPGSTSPKETITPQRPVQTPKSPGFGSVISVAVLLLAIYINKRK